MARSERAKQLEAEQKAARKAAKERRKNSDNPADWGRMRQMVEAFKVTRQIDPAVTWFMIGAFLGVAAVFILIGLFLLPPWWMWLIFGITFGLLAAMATLTWRARKAAYKRYAGQPGSGELGLNMLSKKWVTDPAIAVTRYQDVVHRTVGPGGIVLVGEGQAGRVRQLLASEAKKHEAIKYGVTVTTLVVGDQPNQVKLDQLTKTIKKLPKVLKGSEVTELRTRLRALDAQRPRIPLPKGPMPTSKGARQALRGR
ncbi:MAG: DUF4191 domain-containing protein [Propionibacteriaceae bacterium]|jgi:hypothetical protein|nr:DUF4191 domain-containing protein [Propionibacteriaceae bacterium]